MLLPPTVQGPINALASTITVVGAIEGSTVQLHSNGAPIGPPSPATGLATVVNLGAATLVAGQQITATQSKNGETSGPSTIGEPVAAAPTPQTGLPAVTFLSKLSPCVDWVVLGGCIAGTTVEVFHLGQSIGDAVAQGPQVSVPIRFPAAPGAGDILEAAQKVALPGGTIVQGPRTPSLPIGGRLAREIKPPNLAPPFECDMAVLVSELFDGASLSIRHNGNALRGYPFVGNTVWANLIEPVQRGDELSGQQVSEQCHFDSGFGPNVGVNPSPKLPTPIIAGPVCPNAKIVRVGNLRPGATVTIYRKTKDSNGGSSSAPLGQGRAWAPECDLQLPLDWINHPQPALTPGKLYITVTQENCASASDTAEHPVEPLPGIIETPQLIAPTECARVVAAQSLTPGAVVVVESDQPDAPTLTAPTLVTTPTAAIPLYRPLRAREFLQIKQSGCNAAAESPQTEVQPFDALPEPTIVGPVRIPHGGVNLADLLVGARVHLFVRDQLADSFDAKADKMFVPLPGLPLEAAIYARQAMCTRISDKSNIEVTRLGQLSVNHLPPPATRTKPSTVTVAAKDSDTNIDVFGQVKIGPNVVGATGTPFAYTFAMGAPPASEVTAPDYAAAPIAWNLIDPTPPATPMLRLSLVNQAPAYFAITNIEWQIAKQQLDGTLIMVAAPTGQAVALPLPGPGNYHVYAGVSVTELVNGFSLLADFRGDVVTDGVSRLVFVWNNVDHTQQFRLFAETQVITAGGGSYTRVNPVVAPI